MKHGQRRRGKRGLIIVAVALLVALVGGVSYLAWPQGSRVPDQRVQLARPKSPKPQEEETLPGDSNPQIAKGRSGSSPVVRSGHGQAMAIFHGPSNKRVVALTFDDGPSSYTPQIALVLAKDKAPATFFCIGKEAAKDPQEIARLQVAGFEVENHTWDHPQLNHLTLAAILAEITRTNQVIGPATYLRPPYGAFNATVSEAAASLGMKLVLWDVDTLDWKYRSVASILRYLKAEVRPGSIILMHDGGGNRSQTAAALPQVISWLRSQDYALATVDQLVQTLPVKGEVNPGGKSPGLE